MPRLSLPFLSQLLLIGAVVGCSSVSSNDDFFPSTAPSPPNRKRPNTDTSEPPDFPEDSGAPSLPLGEWTILESTFDPPNDVAPFSWSGLGPQPTSFSRFGFTAGRSAPNALRFHGVSSRVLTVLANSVGKLSLRFALRTTLGRGARVALECPSGLVNEGLVLFSIDSAGRAQLTNDTLITTDPLPSNTWIDVQIDLERTLENIQRYSVFGIVDQETAKTTASSPCSATTLVLGTRVFGDDGLEVEDPLDAADGGATNVPPDTFDYSLDDVRLEWAKLQ